jgi:hypothetical protein
MEDGATRDMLLLGIGVEVGDRHVKHAHFYASHVELAARKLSATPSDMPGLWHAPGYPELTTGQLLSIANARA